MRRFAPAAVFVLLAAAAASAQTVRVEIGLNGVYPAGGWVSCRVSGLDNVADGALVTLRVSDMFVREMRVERGVAEGLILIPDEAPSISLDVAGRSVRVAPEDLARLQCTKDALHPGSVRPDLYEIFGPPEWPRDVRRNVLLCFLGLLVVWALWAVAPSIKGLGRVIPLGGVLILCVIFPILAFRLSTPRPESVAVFECAEGSNLGTLTEIRSLVHLRLDGDSPSPILEGFADAVPAAATRRDWLERPILMDAQGKLTQVPRVPSRDVAWRRDPLALFIERPDMHPRDARVRALREAAERWWRASHPADASEFALSWTAPVDEGSVFSAGTLVAVRSRWAWWRSTP